MGSNKKQKKRRYRKRKRNDHSNNRWEAPHIDAEVYIEDFIKHLGKCSLRWVDELEAPEPELFFGTSRKIGSIIFEEYLDWDYEAHTEIDDDMAFIQEKLEFAKTALAAREIEDLLDAIESLIDERSFNVPTRISEVTDLENWFGLLDYPVTTKDERERKSEEAQRYVALAVRTLSECLCELIAKNPLALWQVEWRQLEYVIATALDKIGFKVKLTPPAKDGGKDIIASCVLRGKNMVFYVEVKHWRSGKHVGSRNIFDFLEVNALDRTEGGLFLSSSGYSRSVYSHLAEFNQQHIRLGKFEKILLLCQHFVRKESGIWNPIQSLPDVLFERTIKK